MRLYILLLEEHLPPLLEKPLTWLHPLSWLSFLSYDKSVSVIDFQKCPPFGRFSVSPIAGVKRLKK